MNRQLNALNAQNRNAQQTGRNDIKLIYDRECPACHLYCTMVRVRESVGELALIDARTNSQELDAITARGWDIDNGMVLIIGENFFYGADAIHALALISTPSGVFNRLAATVFSSPSIAARLYPVLRRARNVLLRLLGRRRINNLGLADNMSF